MGILGDNCNLGESECCEQSGERNIIKLRCDCVTEIFNSISKLIEWNQFIRDSEKHIGFIFTKSGTLWICFC